MISGKLIAVGIAVVSLSGAVITENDAERHKVSDCLSKAVVLADAVTDGVSSLRAQNIPISEENIETQLMMNGLVPHTYIHNHFIASPISDNLSSSHYVPISVRMNKHDVIIDFPHVTPQRSSRIKKYIAHHHVKPKHNVTVQTAMNGDLEMRIPQ